ncbi:hypothetical protein QTI04_16605 [Variovorax sp. J22R115]|nr:hypothetical protein [Variovorax sp. J22R115]MDM0050628.1 hypothetical protein [Variovorax sp. J22R115]
MHAHVAVAPRRWCCSAQQNGDNSWRIRFREALERKRHLLPREIDLGHCFAPVQHDDPIRPYEHQHDSCRLYGVTHALREDLTGNNCIAVVEKSLGVEPLRKAVVQPPSVAARVATSVANEDH